MNSSLSLSRICGIIVATLLQVLSYTQSFFPTFCINACRALAFRFLLGAVATFTEFLCIRYVTLLLATMAKLFWPSV